MSKNEQNAKKTWPKDCVWPKPLALHEGMAWDEDLIDIFTIDEDVQDLLDIKDYYDELVEDGLLDDEYRLNLDYCPEDKDDSFALDDDEMDSDNEGEEADSDENDEDDDDEGFDPDTWEPKKGKDYWDEDQFQIEWWYDDLSDAMNRLKLSDFPGENDLTKDPVYNIESAIDYRFINENLLRQAFTRRAFAIEYGLKSELNIRSASHAGCNEELEFLGDSILNMVVTKEIMKHHGVLDSYCPSAPYQTRFDEGVFSKMKSAFICKEHLAARAAELGLDKYILYGTGETESESAKEDMMEALIGAVAIDSDWDMKVLEKLIDQLINLQVDCPDSFLRKSYYDIVNAWHQRHFNCLPNYQVDPAKDGYYGIIRFHVPENNKDIHTSQLLTAEGMTRSEARTNAAEKAYFFIMNNGFWANLKNCGIVPNLDNSIGQLQELYQKKYIRELPTYEFSEDVMGGWLCDCYFEGFHAYGKAVSKVAAKKQAAFMGLTRLFQSAGLAK